MEQNLINKKIHGIYMIMNNVNGKIYIGQSIDILTRWRQHLWHAKRGNENFLYKSIRKYGEEHFSFSILMETDELDYYEKFFIKLYHSDNNAYGYNLTAGGQEHGWKEFNEKVKNGEIDHPMKNHIWTEEQKLNMSNGRKGKYKGEDHYFSKMSDADKKSFVKEKCGAFTAEWWNNGIEQIRSFECPGKGWVRGMCIKNSSWGISKGTKWWNNGNVSVRSKVCPEGFVPGRLKKN